MLIGRLLCSVLGWGCACLGVPACTASTVLSLAGTTGQHCYLGSGAVRDLHCVSIRFCAPQVPCHNRVYFVVRLRINKHKIAAKEFCLCTSYAQLAGLTLGVPLLVLPSLSACEEAGR